ncbi:hypothetical protein [Actinomycetospora termitidis]|uniref:Uncharacterized protein n=1 Tax=Actinomycetospora termitidis TaxID=3053470 RepID=A0ABT7M9C1_9PSEU|nr:hypothetical protein [Actinomycetospora sp. Odt1-22]MDL5156794.1 hypothetical protein [Actinomycetospora sp. Odt1-22]
MPHVPLADGRRDQSCDPPSEDCDDEGLDDPEDGELDEDGLLEDDELLDDGLLDDDGALDGFGALLDGFGADVVDFGGVVVFGGVDVVEPGGVVELLGGGVLDDGRVDDGRVGDDDDPVPPGEAGAGPEPPDPPGAAAGAAAEDREPRSPGPASGPRAAARSTCVGVGDVADVPGAGRPRSVMTGAAGAIGAAIGPCGVGVDVVPKKAPSSLVIASEVEVPVTVWNTAVLTAAAPMSDTPATAIRRRRACVSSGEVGSPWPGEGTSVANSGTAGPDTVLHSTAASSRRSVAHSDVVPGPSAV